MKRSINSKANTSNSSSYSAHIFIFLSSNRAIEQSSSEPWLQTALTWMQTIAVWWLTNQTKNTTTATTTTTTTIRRRRIITFYGALKLILTKFVLIYLTLDGAAGQSSQESPLNRYDLECYSIKLYNCLVLHIYHWISVPSKMDDYNLQNERRNLCDLQEVPKALPNITQHLSARFAQLSVKFSPKINYITITYDRGEFPTVELRWK